MRLATNKVLQDIEEWFMLDSGLRFAMSGKVIREAKDIIESQRKQLRHLEKMVVWAEDIKMTGKNSEEYENGFWDAVNYVKTIQSQHGLYGMN